MMKLSTNSALDYEYLEMLEHIYKNTETQVIQSSNIKDVFRKIDLHLVNIIMLYCTL